MDQAVTGHGELRHADAAGAGATCGSYLLLGVRTMLLHASVASDGRGQFFRVTAPLSPDGYTEGELDRLLAVGGVRGGLDMAQTARSGPLVDDPIPFGAA